MRTDRRAPLVAFIVVAIIAVILLVTSVRSQAAPGLAPPIHHAAGAPTLSVAVQASGATVAETVSSAASSTT